VVAADPLPQVRSEEIHSRGFDRPQRRAATRAWDWCALESSAQIVRQQPKVSANQQFCNFRNLVFIQTKARTQSHRIASLRSFAYDGGMMLSGAAGIDHSWTKRSKQISWKMYNPTRDKSAMHGLEPNKIV
jgi:hypothetical protein